MNLKPYPEYKESGVPWLGELPTEWWAVPFKTQVDRNDGGVWGEDPDTETGTPVLRSTEQTVEGHWAITDPALRLLSTREAATFKLMTGDLLITKSSGSKAHIGKTTLVTPDVESMGAAYSNFMQRVRLSRTNSPRFFWYLMRSNAIREQITVLSTTTTGLANLTATVIGSFVVPNLPLAEQHAIADFLDRETGELDAFIADQEELIALLAERRTATVTRAVTKGLNPDVPVKDSGTEWLGSIPEHWQTRKIKTIVTIPITDGPHETPEILPEGVPFVSAEAVSSGNINFEKVRGFISEEDNLRFSKKYLPRKHDIFMVKSGATTGLCAIVDTDLRFNIWSPLAAIRCNQETSPRFLLHALRSLNFQESVRLFWNYGTQQNIGMKVLENLPIPYPDLEEQKSIATYLDQEISEINAAIADAQETIALSKERRAAVISAAVTGKIDVRGLVAPATNNVEAESVGIA
ncbi:restriction endonuclease subunit S [Glutamicibacter protophormiae]